jgi:hypothetical protein
MFLWRTTCTSMHAAAVNLQVPSWLSGSMPAVGTLYAQQGFSKPNPLSTFEMLPAHREAEHFKCMSWQSQMPYFQNVGLGPVMQGAKSVPT